MSALQAERASQLDFCETLARKYLESLNPSGVIFEPQGYKTAPDFEVAFEVGMKIGVEVRRLNQHYLHSSKSRGLDDVATPLLMRIEKLFKSDDDYVQPPTPSGRWYVSYHFRRTAVHPQGPLSRRQWSKVWKYILACVEEVKKDRKTSAFHSAVGEVEIPETLISVDFLNLPGDSNAHIQVAGFTDGDSWGWKSELLEKNLDICVREKTKKRVSWETNYSTRWLVLVDFVAYGSRVDFAVKHDWDRIIVINPLKDNATYLL